MKITGVFANYSGLNNTNYDKSNNFIFTNLNAQYDSVSFTGNPKGFKPVKKAVKKVVEKSGNRQIKNSFYAQLSNETQTKIENIHTNFDNVKHIYKNLLCNTQKANEVRQGYKSFVLLPNKQGLTFKMPEEDKTVTILQNRNKANLLRLIVEEKNAQKPQHFLIDGYDKVVANLMPNYPQILPPKFRYMTTEQIEASNVKKYIDFADEQMNGYVDYLRNASLKTEALKSEKIKTLKTKIKPLPALKRGDSVESLLKIFNAKPEELSSHLKLVVSKQNNKVLGFTMDTEDGGKLKVFKKMSSEHKDDLRYLSIEKVSPDGNKSFLALDLGTKSFLKTSVATGKPTIINEAVYEYSPAELKQMGVNEQLSKFVDEIYKTDTETNPQEITLLNNLKKTRKSKEISVEELEDKRLNKILDEEARADKLENKPDVLADSVDNIKPKEDKVAESTKIEDVPKVASATEKLVVQEVKDIKKNAAVQATNDAKVFVEEYFKVFAEQVKQEFVRKLDDFKTMLNEIVKNH